MVFFGIMWYFQKKMQNFEKFEFFCKLNNFVIILCLKVSSVMELEAYNASPETWKPGPGLDPDPGLGRQILLQISLRPGPG